MMKEEPDTPKESSPTQIVEDVLSSLEPQRPEIAIVPQEVGEEASRMILERLRKS